MPNLYEMARALNDIEYANDALNRLAHNPHCYQAVLAQQAKDEAVRRYEEAEAEEPIG